MEIEKMAGEDEEEKKLLDNIHVDLLKELRHNILKKLTQIINIIYKANE